MAEKRALKNFEKTASRLYLPSKSTILTYQNGEYAEYQSVTRQKGAKMGRKGSKMGRKKTLMGTEMGRKGSKMGCKGTLMGKG